VGHLENAPERNAAVLIAIAGAIAAVQKFDLSNLIAQGRPLMFRTGICIATALVMAGVLAATLTTAFADTSTPVPPSASSPAPSRMKLTRERLHEMRVKWKENRAKLAACRKDVKSKGLIGDDRWFYIEDCMTKP
jgi:hypothetical protein